MTDQKAKRDKILPLFLLFVVPIFVLNTPVFSFQGEDKVVIPPDAQAKAEEALKRLGPDRGALSLDFKVLTIEGIIRGVSARMEKIKKALDDLGAKETEADYIIELEGDVLFDFDKWDIREDAEEILLQVGGIIRSYNHPVTITGHTDSKGSDDYNMDLSKKRAESVKNWLVEQAEVDASLIETAGKGESEPVALNTNPDGSDNPEGRQKNRRVEIRIRK